MRHPNSSKQRRARHALDEHAPRAASIPRPLDVGLVALQRAHASHQRPHASDVLETCRQIHTATELLRFLLQGRPHLGTDDRCFVRDEVRKWTDACDLLEGHIGEVSADARPGVSFRLAGDEQWLLSIHDHYTEAQNPDEGVADAGGRVRS